MAQGRATQIANALQQHYWLVGGMQHLLDHLQNRVNPVQALKAVDSSFYRVTETSDTTAPGSRPSKIICSFVNITDVSSPTEMQKCAWNRSALGKHQPLAQGTPGDCASSKAGHLPAKSLFYSLEHSAAGIYFTAAIICYLNGPATTWQGFSKVAGFPVLYWNPALLSCTAAGHSRQALFKFSWESLNSYDRGLGS